MRDGVLITAGWLGQACEPTCVPFCVSCFMQAILKMMKVGFAYPNTERKILADVSIYITLSSRVAVLGANGAGKSTMIKLLTGELEPVEGTVWKHPNLRIAYVAQHAFHHIEQHLDKTANQYIQVRTVSDALLFACNLCVTLARMARARCRAASRSFFRLRVTLFRPSCATYQWDWDLCSRAPIQRLHVNLFRMGRARKLFLDTTAFVFPSHVCVYPWPRESMSPWNACHACVSCLRVSMLANYASLCMCPRACPCTQWRYAIGEDREALNKVDRKITEEEAKKMAQVHVIDGVKRVVEKILGRRKLKSSYEYEVSSRGHGVFCPSFASCELLAPGKHCTTASGSQSLCCLTAC